MGEAGGTDSYEKGSGVRRNAKSVGIPGTVP
jgi:hypothetical protein